MEEFQNGNDRLYEKYLDLNINYQLKICEI